MVDKNIKLVNVIQVMLFRRILPCQSRTCNLWEFDPAKHQTLQQFFGSTHEEIWKVLFKAGEMPLPMTEDRGLSLKRQANPVSSFNVFKAYPLLAYFEKKPKLSYLCFQAWIKIAEGINCSAPLPEDQEFPLLTKMLFPAPYEVPEKTAKKAAVSVLGTGVPRPACLRPAA